jgi:chemotaxis protein MotB
MRSPWVIGIGLIVAGLLLSGCNNTLKDENALLMEENQDLRMQLEERNAALDSATARARDREMEATRLRRELEESRRAPQTGTGAHGFEGIAGVTGTHGEGEVTATIESDLLFASGSATLTANAKRALDQVAQVLNSQYAGRPVRIAGHTDTDPIRRSGFKSNYHLGFERAFAVREYLISRGIAANRLYLASHGPDRGKDTKARSRRVELVVVLN